MTLTKNCKPRQSVFDRERRDTVLNLSDLLENKLDEQAAHKFFSENFVTAGMKLLIQKSFDRISGKRDQPAAYLLSQAMGGGKTHSMIALGLLARYPSIRARLGDGFELGNDPVRVIGFDGREVDYPYGLWGALAEQLGKRELFHNLYSPLQAPGVTSWVNLLKNEALIILLDELPPYLNNARAIPVGASNLAEVTSAALSNLLVAANRDELSKIVIVISDLSGTAYGAGQTFINEALDNLRQETQRFVVPIEPVATQGDEIFHILRTRLFEKLPDITIRDAVACRYADAVEKAKQMDLTSESPASFAALLRESYPFHYSLRDLYGRFKANAGFQQTRGLLRLMRAVVANLWESGEAESLELIHPYNINLNDPDIFNEFSTINPNLSEAIRHDIANHGQSAAEQLDQKIGGGSQAQHAAKLLFVASLSTAQNPELGLREHEIIAWLCRPDYDISRMHTDVLEQLPTLAWYLHVSNDGRLYFKNVRNLAATLHSYVESYTKETRIKELREYLNNLFRPNRKDVYQQCLVLPTWDEIQPTIDNTVLVIVEPHPVPISDQVPLHPDLVRFYENLELKNRILFLTGDRDTMGEVLKHAAHLKAIRTVLAEQEGDHLSEKDPQRVEAKRSLDRILINLRSSLQQTYSVVIYPSADKLRREDIRFTFDSNNFDGEEQIRKALLNARKFSDDTADLDTWVAKVEDRLFDNQNPVRWKDIKARAATKTVWQLHLPRLFDDIKTHAVRTGKWKEEGEYIRKGPFPKEPTSVNVRVKSRDEETGTAVLEIRPIGGNRVYYEIGDRMPNTASEPVRDYTTFETKDLKLTFLCMDEMDVNREARPVVWKNQINLKSRLYDQGGESYLELLSTPQAPILYTTDGSDPRTNGSPYAGPFPIPRGCRLVQAIAKKDDVESELLRRDVTSTTPATLDPARPLTWNVSRRFYNLPTSEAWQLVTRLTEHNGKAEGVSIYFELPDTGGEEITYTTPVNLGKSGAELRALIDHIQAFAQHVNLTLTVQRIRFERGQDFLDWVNQDRIPYNLEREVKQ